MASVPLTAMANLEVSTIDPEVHSTTAASSYLPVGGGTDAEDDASSRIFYDEATAVFATVCASIFTLIGTSGNLLTVVALLRCPKLRTHATTVFVISLAVSDLLFSTLNLPLTAVRFAHQEWRLGDTMCRLFPFFFYGNVAASLMSMVAITMNRFVLIVYHAQYAKVYTKSNIGLMVLAIWLFSFGMMVPPLAGVWGDLGLDEATFSCTILRKDGESPKKFLMLFGFLMPCVVIVGCYSAIFAKVRQSRRNLQSHQASSSTSAQNGASSSWSSKGGVAISDPAGSSAQTRSKEDLKLTKMVLTIFLCFLVCFMPLMLVNVADDGVTYPFLHVLASILAWASAVINPFIYAFQNRQYQQAFAKVLHIKVGGASEGNRRGGCGGGGACWKSTGGGLFRNNNSRMGLAFFWLEAKLGRRAADVSGESGKNEDSKNSTATAADGGGASSSRTFLTDTIVSHLQQQQQQPGVANEAVVPDGGDVAAEDGENAAGIVLTGIKHCNHNQPELPACHQLHSNHR